MKRLLLVLLLIGVPVFCLTAQESGNEQTETSEITTVDETELLIEDTQTGTDLVPEERNLNSFGMWDFVRMIIILAAVVGVIYLIFFLLKRTANPKMQNNELMRVLSTQTIANNRSLHLVEVGRQIFLIGVGDNSVNLVSEITDKESIDELRLRISEQTSGEKRRFKDVLSGLFGQTGMKQEKIYPMKMDESTQFIKQQRERLKNL
jgi:flagellar protein FliO/FliZ